MIKVGDTGLWFDGGHKGHFEIYMFPHYHIFKNPFRGTIVHLTGENVDCSGEIFKAILEYGDFRIDGRKFLKSNEWIIKEAIKKQIEGNQYMTKCYNCGIDSEKNPITVDVDGVVHEACPPMLVDADWERTYLPLSYHISSDKFIDISNAPIISLKDVDLRWEYTYLHMICKIKSIKNPVVTSGKYRQQCVFYGEDTSKIIKAELQDTVSDFDKWSIGDKVETLGIYEEGIFKVTFMRLIESDESIPIAINRNDETPGYNEWRTTILKRDKKCICCGYDKHLEAHHLFGYKENPSLAVNESNGVTLCKFCHEKYHSIYGLKNINPVDFMNFIKRFGVK